MNDVPNLDLHHLCLGAIFPLEGLAVLNPRPETLYLDLNPMNPEGPITQILGF